jgi:hypothetical protein
MEGKRSDARAQNKISLSVLSPLVLARPGPCFANSRARRPVSSQKGGDAPPEFTDVHRTSFQFRLPLPFCFGSKADDLRSDCLLRRTRPSLLSDSLHVSRETAGLACGLIAVRRSRSPEVLMRPKILRSGH